MQHSCIPFHTIKPFVRFAQDIYILPDQAQKTVKSYDHRLFYIVSGVASIEIDDLVKEISPGSVLYWMSGAAYRFDLHAGQPLHMIAINFDYTQASCETVQYLPLVLPQDYSEGSRMEDISFSDVAALNAPILLHGLPNILPYMQQIVNEAASPVLYSNLYLSNLLSVVLTCIARAASQRQAVKGQIRSYQQITEYINSHYTEEISNSYLAEKFGYHPKYISQLITQHTGTSLHQYLLKVRIRNAIYLLQTTQMPINEVAHRVGFRNASYFSEYFRHCTGYSPRAFRIK